MRKVRVTPRHPQAAVPDFRQDDRLIHACVLHPRNTTVTECVHRALGDSESLADGLEHVPVDIANFQGSAEPRHENSSFFLL